MLDCFHIVKSGCVFEDKWEQIAKKLSVDFLLPQGIYSAMLCLGAMNKGKINQNMFSYVLSGYGFLSRVDEFKKIFIKYKCIDKKFNLIDWKQHQNEDLQTEAKIKESKAVECRLSLIELSVEYLVDKKKDPRLYQAWYFQRSKKGLSCKATYDILTKKGYKIDTKEACNNQSLVSAVELPIGAVDKKLISVDNSQTLRSSFLKGGKGGSNLISIKEEREEKKERKEEREERKEREEKKNKKENSFFLPKKTFFLPKKNFNEVKQEIDIKSCFQELWDLYPKKEGREYSLDSFKKVIKEHKFEDIKSGVIRYVSFIEEEHKGGFKRGIKGFSGFLLQSSFLDNWKTTKQTEIENKQKNEKSKEFFRIFLDKFMENKCPWGNTDFALVLMQKKSELNKGYYLITEDRYVDAEEKEACKNFKGELDKFYENNNVLRALG